MIEVIVADHLDIWFPLLDLLLQHDEGVVDELEEHVGKIVEQCNGTHVEGKPLVLEVERLLQRLATFT